MKLEFLGADHEVTGSCHYLKVGQTHVLIDCGMEQGADLYVNQEIPVNASEVDYVLVTHAHIDHSGLLPLTPHHLTSALSPSMTAMAPCTFFKVFPVLTLLRELLPLTVPERLYARTL